MSHLSALFDRAEVLRGHGLTERRIFQNLRKEFPNAERDVLLRAAKLEGSPRGVTPGWALWGQPLRPVQIRFKARGTPPKEEDKVKVRTKKVIAMNYPLLTIEARDLGRGDWIEGIGQVIGVVTHKEWTTVFADHRTFLYRSDAHVIVRLEDEGGD